MTTSSQRSSKNIAAFIRITLRGDFYSLVIFQNCTRTERNTTICRNKFEINLFIYIKIYITLIYNINIYIKVTSQKIILNFLKYNKRDKAHISVIVRRKYGERLDQINKYWEKCNDKGPRKIGAKREHGQRLNRMASCNIQAKPY